MLRRLRGMRFDGLYFTYWMDTGYEGGGRSIVWPWKFGWRSAQMYEVFYLGPCYLCWAMS
jgi:hypothetical protein